jgi:hypothetical protein
MRYRPLTFLALAAALLFGAACSDDGDTATTQVTSETTDTSDLDNGSASGQDQTDSGAGDVDEAASEADEQTEDPPALELILDASGSMNTTGADGRTLLDGAKQALRDLVNELPNQQHVGLRVYGHRYPNTDQENGCRDTELIHPVEPLDRDGLLQAIDGYEAKGFTPIGLSLQEAGNDLPAEGPRTIVLVSDGVDTCGDPDPCDVAEDLAADGVDVVINTVGFALDQAAPQDAAQARDQLQCIADAGNGAFVDVENAGQLTDALDDVAREERSYEVGGGELVGAPIPREAETGQVDTPYTDVVLGGETNYYRFEVTQGTEVQGELIVPGNPRAHEALLCPDVYLVDEGDDELARPTDHSGGPGDQTFTKLTEPITVEDDEIWMRVAHEGCTGETLAEDLEFDVEIQLTTVE